MVVVTVVPLYLTIHWRLVFAVTSLTSPIFPHSSSGNVPYGIHEIDVKLLSSGPHLFILKVQDGYGKSLMKLHHFTVGTGL
jgi:hypothetical protein